MPEANVAKQRMTFGRMPMANVFDGQDNNRSGVMRVYAETVLFRRA